MIFISLVIVAIVSYVLGYKAPAFIVFFFFLTFGFNLISEEVFKDSPISKGSDYAFIILTGIIIIDIFISKNFLKYDRFLILLFIFGCILFTCIAWSKWVVNLTWSEVIRSSRYQFFWIAYFVFRNMEKKQLEQLLKYLFNITVVLSILYLLQIILNKTILNEAYLTSAWLFGIRLPRYYNQPDLIQFFALMAVFHNPHKGLLKIITTTVLILALLGAFHRSISGLLPFSILLGFILKLPHIRKIQVLSVLLTVVIGSTLFAGIRFMDSRTYKDLQFIRKGLYTEVEDIDPDDFLKSTFTFRIAIMYERNQYLWDHPENLMLGIGLIPEDSPQVNKYDFKIGLLDEVKETTIQIDCGDISYPSMILRLGYLGTAIYLTLLIYLTVFFYKNHKNKYGLVSFVYMIFSFGVSFFSSNLLLPATYLMPLITYCIIQKTKEENDSPNILQPSII